MPGSTPFRLNRSGVMLALISAAFASEAGAVAGRAEFTIGGVTVAGPNGIERPLRRGAELDSGDVIRTNNGRAQIRFTDGAYVSLQPNTQFGIREYVFENKTDGSERGFFGLLKGAMRTVTGLIGRVNRDRYQITTPTATVGIRGTGGIIQVRQDGSTLIIGTSGIWSLTNPSGSIDVPAGVSGLSPSEPDQPPRETNQPPTSGPAPIPEQPPLFVQGEERTATGEPLVPTITPFVSGSGYAIAVASDVFPNVTSSESALATFDSASHLTEASFSTPNSGSFDYNLVGGSHAEFHFDGLLAWGRWIGPVATTATVCEGTCMNDYLSDQGVHYVVGLPTATLPTSGSATYLASTATGTATSPTYRFGGTGVGSFSGRLDVNFGARATILGTFNVAMPGGVAYDWTASGNASGSSFAMSTNTVNGCSSSCSASAQGFFSGPSAERAGVSYNVQDGLGQKAIVGAAAFQKQ